MKMEKTFKEFMARRYAEAEEFACGVTREQEDIAHEAWEFATNAEREACVKVCDELAYSRRGANSMRTLANRLRRRAAH